VSPAGSATRPTMKGASCCTAQPSGPREPSAVEVNPAQVPRAGNFSDTACYKGAYMDNPTNSVNLNMLPNATELLLDDSGPTIDTQG
jgi:hypothetical protein